MQNVNIMIANDRCDSANAMAHGLTQMRQFQNGWIMRYAFSC
jgi:hypothetical protein